MSKADDLKTLELSLEESFSTLPLAEKPEDIVHGEGDQQAEVMMIGEAPGFYEARDRRPFVGRSGQLLRKVMKEVGLDPTQVFISNIVKVRPPDNRDPKPEEILAYKPFLDREIELIDPKLIVTLGRFSMAKFLPDVKISQVHGRLHKIKWNDKTLFILPMYHPAAALRATRVKDSFIKDFEKINKIIDWLEKQEEVMEFKEEIKDSLF
jgi:DNA polymerase